MNAAWVMFWGGSRSTKRCVFRAKWLQPAMKGTSSVRRVRLGSFHARIVPPMCVATIGCSSVRSSMRFWKLWLQIALEWLRECCMGYVLGRKQEHETLFFRVKWLQPPKKGTPSVQRMRLRSLHAQIVPPMCLATSGCSCVRSFMRFLNLWLHDRIGMAA